MLFECSHGTWYNGFYINRTSLVCSTGSYVLNGKLCVQQESILGATLEINGVPIVVGVNNIPNIRPAVIYIPLKRTLPYEFDVWFLNARLE